MIHYLFISLFSFFWGTCHTPWIVYYNDKAPVEAFEQYDPIIFSSFSHPPLEPLLKKNKQLLGYLDLTEVSEWDYWYSESKKEGLFLEKNVNFPGSWIIDIRHPFWKQFVLEKLIPSILEQGFTGLFLDQIDIAIDLEKRAPQKFKGMRVAAVDLVKSINQKFPRALLMLNRGYELLPELGNTLQYVLAETLYTSYNFTTKSYYVRPRHENEWQLAQLKAAQTQFPHLTFFSLDYWDPQDKEMYKEIYKQERSFKFCPYVSTLALDTIIPEP